MTDAQDTQRSPRCRYISQGDVFLCVAVRPPEEVAPTYAQRICTGGFWYACPRYRQAEGIAQPDDEPEASPANPIAIERSAKESARPRRMPWRPVLDWVATLVFAVTLGLLAGTLIRQPDLLFGASSPPSSGAAQAQPTETPTANVILLDATRTAEAALAPATETPTATSSPTPTHTASPTPSPTATATPEPSPTPTTEVTATETAAPTATPTATAMPTQPPTAIPTTPPTATPFPAPALLAPADGQRFAFTDEVRLQWSSLGALPADAYYVITLAYPHGNATWYDETPWLKETSWRVNEHSYLPELSNDGSFVWSVRVMRRTGQDAQGRPTGVPLGRSSAQRTFHWARQTGGGSPAPGPQPTPPPPPP